jgi:hypothetical protein
VTEEWLWPAITAAAGLVGTVAAAQVGAWNALRQTRRLKHMSQTEAAAQSLAESLRELRQLVRQSGYGPVEPQDVAQAMQQFQMAWDEHEHRLPQNWPHLRTEINHAVGTHFGPVGWSNVFLDQQSAPLTPVDATWWENAEKYLDHVIGWVARWGDGQKPSPGPMRFDPWIAARRRGMDEGPPLSWPLRLLLWRSPSELP